uniref:M-phase-specific PLK1-interacting protein n=1 Tax=Petromyzon marinus TaxID=7757 RepID=A0AAJ7X8P5_PETMA|nr:M-phase-specific PLK1-interacting protein [Petromyzon marinus]
MFRPRGNSSLQQQQQQQQYRASTPSPHHGGFGPTQGGQQSTATSPRGAMRFVSATSPQTVGFQQQQQLMMMLYQQQQQFSPQQQQFSPQQQQFKQQCFQTPSPRFSPYGQQRSPRGAPWRGETPRGRASWQQGSPRMPGSRSPWHGRADREASVDCYYKSSMVQDPWRGLVPVSVSDVEGGRDREVSGRHAGRYFGRLTA